MKHILLIVLLGMAGVAYAESRISLQSDQGDWIGGGQDRELTGDFNLSVSKSSISIYHTSGFSFAFVPPNDRELIPGSFLLAERSPFRGPLNPGIDVGSPGRGCNTISGEFHIYEIDYNTENPVLAMDFIQYCDSTVAKLSGSIRINSDIQIPYPLPLAIISGDASSVIEGATFSISGAKSMTHTGALVDFAWEQVSGPSITFDDSKGKSVVIGVNSDVELGGEDVIIKLTVTDNLGQTDTVERAIRVKSKSDPQTYFHMFSGAGDYIGAGRDWSYNQGNSSISASKNYANGVSVSISGSEWWSADFAAPDRELLKTGNYDLAERFPFQSAGTAGLDISGDGRGCNRSYGSFNVSKLVWDNGQLASFKATFEQHCESPSATPLTGEVAFNAVHDSVPYASAGDNIEIKEHEVVNLNGSDSFDNLGSIASYLWRATDDSVAITNADQSRAHFVAPALPDRVDSADIDVALLVTDDEGYKAIDHVSVRIIASNKAPVSQNDAFDVVINGSVQLSPLTNDQDNDGRIMADSITITQQPTLGTAVINAQGLIEYTHTGGVAGEDRITYTVKDNDGAVSNEATIVIKAKDKVVVTNTDKASSGGGGVSDWLLMLLTFAMALRVTVVMKQ